MFKYFRSRPVSLRYEYNDSQGNRTTREGALSYDSFELRGSGGYFHVVLRCNGATVWEQEFDLGWTFNGLGVMRMNNSGPYCHFTIRFS